MLDSKIERIAREQIRIEFEERERLLGREVVTAQGAFSKRGTLHSSMCIRAIGEVFQNELKIRAELALAILRRVCGEVGVQATPELAPSMKAFLDEIVGHEADKLSAHMLRTPPVGTAGRAGTADAAYGVGVERSFERVRENALSMAKTEVDLFDARLAAVSKKVEGNQVTVMGTGNVVQTGIFTGSPMTIVIDSGARVNLEKALTIVEVALANVPEPSSINVLEIRDMVADSKAELAKPQPNSTKLGAMLGAVATTIQTVASLRPAYDALKGALALCGIPLP